MVTKIKSTPLTLPKIPDVEIPVFDAISKIEDVMLRVAKKVNLYSKFKIFCIGLKTLWILFSKSQVFFYLTYPIRFIYDKIIDHLDAIHYKCDAYFEPRENIFSEEDIAKIRENYWALGEEKWKEGIDGRHHYLGKRVYDLGLHEGPVEPGFIRSWERATHFLNAHIGEKVTPELYLQIHTLACGHFIGETNSTLMGQEKVGVFRNKDDINIYNGEIPSRDITKKAESEIKELKPQPSYMLDINFGETNTKRLMLVELSEEDIHGLFSQFLEKFYTEIYVAKDEDAKFQAIARLHVRLEFLHPTRDGSTRTNLLLINFLLCHYLDHPALLDNPNEAPWKGSLDWKDKLKTGFKNWEKAKNGSVKA